jgi:hypothetical protein
MPVPSQVVCFRHYSANHMLWSKLVGGHVTTCAHILDTNVSRRSESIDILAPT